LFWFWQSIVLLVFIFSFVHGGWRAGAQLRPGAGGFPHHAGQQRQYRLRKLPQSAASPVCKQLFLRSLLSTGHVHAHLNIVAQFLLAADGYVYGGFNC